MGGPLSTREALTSLLKWQEELLFLGSLRPRWRFFAQRECELCGPSPIVYTRHQKRSTLTRGPQADLS